MFLLDYVIWHFFQAPRDILRASKQVVFYSFTYFSTVALLKTLFSPWRRSAWSYPKAFDIGNFLETFFSNIISRVLGAIVRIGMILFGVVGELCVFLMVIGIFALWLLLPFLIIAGFVYGFILLF